MRVDRTRHTGAIFSWFCFCFFQWTKQKILASSSHRTLVRILDEWKHWRFPPTIVRAGSARRPENGFFISAATWGGGWHVC